MSRLLYLDTKFGISGDMTAGALLDLGADYEKVKAAIESLQLQGFDIAVSRVKKAGIDACDFNVILDHEHHNHDHDMEYLHGHEHHHEHEHHHGHEHHHEHRGMKEIRDIISKAAMSQQAKDTAIHIFDLLSLAEAKAHGTNPDEVHFHEVGAVDSIADIVTVAVCLDDLGVDGIVVEGISDGKGTIRCQHGIMPIPVPAVANLVQQQKLSLKILDVEGELTTPTGAAIAAIRTSDRLPDSFKVLRTGYGAGKRSYAVPSLLRAMLIDGNEAAEASAGLEEDIIIKLESNIDDCTGENLGYVMELLLDEGARDVFFTPIIMKKNRPGQLLSVICSADDVSRLEHIIFNETTTIGIRRSVHQRSLLERMEMTVNTQYGEAEVKICRTPEKLKVYPEYESVKKLCIANGKCYQEMYGVIKAAAITALQQ